MSRYPAIRCPVVLLLGVMACREPSTAPGDSPGLLQFADLATGWGAVAAIDQGASIAINTAALEGCPAETPDGNTLFFASNRDGSIDIWYTERANRQAPWGTPQKVPAPVSLDGVNDFCPSPLPGGELLFVSNRAGGCGPGTTDIYRTQQHPTLGWVDPEHLGCTVNGAGNEFSPSLIDAGGGRLFFSSDGAGGPGQDRIYVSTRAPDGSWGAPTEVTELNASGFSTARPRVSQDGRVIVFDSNRPGGSGLADLWISSRPSRNDPWSAPVNLGSGINSSAAETRAWLSVDGRRLYFGSTRPGQGSTDLYVVER